MALIVAPSADAGPVAGPAVASSARAWGAGWREWLDGLRLVRRDGLLITLFTVMGLAMLGQGILTALNVVFVKDVLHGSAAVFGWMLVATWRRWKGWDLGRHETHDGGHPDGVWASA